MGMLGWRDLRKLNNQRQAGNPVDVPDEEWLKGWDPNAPDAQEQYDKRYHDQFVGNKMTGDEQMAYLKALQDMDLRPKFTQEDVEESGYGESRRDYRVPFDQWIKDPINYRSNAQSAFNQIASGIAKMGFYGIATTLDNTLGLVSGIGNVVADSVNGGEFTPIHSFIDNPFSTEISESLREWADRAMPNYRTREEEEDADHWWNHINANFIGDTFLKNLGFTLGAGVSGRMFAKGFQLSQGRLVNKAYKAALAAAGGDAEAEAAFREVLRGGKMQSAKKIYDIFEKTKKSFNRLNWESQLVGSIGGALGESRMEAMQAAKEFREMQNMYSSQEYDSAKEALQAEVMSNEAFLTEEPVYDGYGNIIGSRPALNDVGKQYYSEKLAELQKGYTEKQKVIDSEAERLANNVFWPNMLVLTGSNAIMFGRMFAGGFKTQAKAKVRGKFGNYKQKGSVASGIGRGMLTALSEGIEELSQKMISEAQKDISDQNVATFHNGKYDERAIKDVSSWISSVVNTVGNVWHDPTSWEEFAIGFLTGGLAETATGGYNRSRKDRKMSADYAEKLNERINQQSFKDLWEGLVRHNHYQNIKDILLDSKINGTGEEVKDRHGKTVGTQFAWQTADDAQIISDVMMFADAGRLEDLESYVDSFARISEEDIPHLSDMLSDDTIEDFDKKSAAEKVAWVKDRAEKIKDTIRQYRDFHDSVDALSFGTSDKEAINELIFTKSQLQNFETRYNNILDSVIKEIRPHIEEVAQEKKADGSPTEDALSAQKLLESESDLRMLFGGIAMNTRGIGQDTQSPIGAFALARDDEYQRKILRKLDEWGTFADNPETEQKVRDLQSLVRARQDYYTRLFNPRGLKSFAERFNNNAKQPEKVAEKISEEERKGKVAEYMDKLRGANTLSEYIKIDRELPELDADTSQALEEERKKDPKVKGFEDKLSGALAFLDSVMNQVSEENNNPTDPQRIQPMTDLEESLRKFPQNVLDFLESVPEGENLELAIAKKILDNLTGNPKAQEEARKIIQSKLTDKAQAASFGSIPPDAGGSGSEEEHTNSSGSTFKAGDTVVDKTTGSQKTVKSISGGMVHFDNGDSGSVDVLDDYDLVPNPGTGSSGGTGTVSQFKHLSDMMGRAVSEDDDLLKKLAAGDFSDYDGLTDKEKLELSAMAAARIESLKSRAGSTATTDGGTEYLGTDERPEGDPQAVRASVENLELRTSALPLDPFPIYVPEDLKKGRIRRFLGNRKNGTAQTLSWMRDHHVQEFIDSGALAALHEMYRKEHKELPVYFLGNPHYIPNNKDNNPFAGPYKGKKYPSTAEVLMAVEMTPENRKALSAFEEQGIFSESTLITVEGKQYQVIGEMWNREPDTWKDKPEKERVLYESVKEQARRTWEYAVGSSILPQYVSERKGNSATFGPEGKWYVAKIHPTADTQETDTHKADWTTGERLHTTLNYMMSGRNETRTLDDDRYHKISLANSLSDYKSVGGQYHFVLFGRDAVSTPGAPEFPSSINAPRGSLWMATKAANGAWEWTAITIKRTNEYDFDANKDSELVKRIRKAFDILFKPTDPFADEAAHNDDFQNRLAAQRELQSLIYLGSGNTLYLDFEESGPVVWIAGARTTSTEDALKHLSSQDMGFRFQVSDDMLSSTKAMENLISAGVLTSEMRSFIRRGASVGVNFLEDRDENGNLVAPYPRANTDEVARTPGSNANAEQPTEAFGSSTPSGAVVNNVRIGSSSYQLRPDGTVYRMERRGLSGDRVDDRRTVAQVKALSELIGVKPKEYPGKMWVIETSVENKTGTKKNNIQYTELYEREVDGITVHMIREGKNGAIMVCYGDAKWNALQESPDIKQAGIQYNTPQKSSEESQAAAQKEFDDIRAAEAREESGKAGSETPEAPKPDEEPKRWRRIVPTVQEEDEKDEENDEEDECGGGTLDGLD